MAALQFVEDLQSLAGIVDQLESCKYECVAGGLENNVEFIRLREIANRWRANKVLQQTASADCVAERPDQSTWLANSHT